MNEADFIALSDHLKEVLPIFQEFCDRHCFVFVERKSLGRYPRVRIERVGDINIWFDLWMEFDANGRRFEIFSRDLPYELSAGAHFDEFSSDGRNRFHKVYQCFSGRSFDEVCASLAVELEKNLPILEGWDVRFLKADGVKTRIS